MDPTIIANFMLESTTVKISETTMKTMARQQTRHAVFVVGGKIHLIPLLIPLLLLLLVQLLTLLVKISVRTMTRISSTQRRQNKIASLLVTRTQNNVVTSIMVLGMKIALFPAKQVAHVTIPRVKFSYGVG
jgi:hypothetical protein